MTADWLESFGSPLFCLTVPGGAAVGRPLSAKQLDRNPVRQADPREEPGMSDFKSFTEELKVEGKELVDTVKRIVHEGNVRRVVIRNADGRTVLDIPVNAGVVGAVAFPLIATLATIAVYAARYTLIIERSGPPAAPPAS
jgi:hypothetical protein